MTVERTATDRGFTVYGPDVTCTYGTNVSVHESSSADRDCVWLTLTQDPQILGLGVEAVAHLDYDQAVAVRDRL